MKKEFSKKEAQEKIHAFFTKAAFTSDDVKKIKRLAMKYKLRLGTYRQRFCKKCYSDLRNGKTRISKDYKTITCTTCGQVSKVKIA